VKLTPPHAVIFKEKNEDNKSLGKLTIGNQSDSKIVFKVKTTQPNNYIVRPNQGVITPQESVLIKIICNVNLDTHVQNIANDKFLV